MKNEQLELPFKKEPSMPDKNDPKVYGPATPPKDVPPNAEKAPPAIEQPKVSVDVKPTKRELDPSADPVKPDHAKKIQKAVEADVKKAVEDNKDKGKKVQVDEAKKAVEKTQGDLKKEGKPVVIDVSIAGKTQDGKPVREQFSVGTKNDKDKKT